MLDIPHRGRVKGQAPISLQRLDYADFDLSFHLRILAVTCLSFFTASYHIFSLPIIKVMISSSIYYDYASPGVPAQYGYMPEGVSEALSGTALVGVAVGQLLFGWLGDVYGRRRALTWCMWWLVLTTLLAVCTSINLVAPSDGPDAFMTNLLCWRMVMGFGIGGIYPLSAVLVSEYAPKALRGTFIAAVFAMQGFGTLAACLMGMAVIGSYRGRITDQCHVNSPCAPLDGSWMIVTGVGLAPQLLALYLNRKVFESPRYTVHVLKDIDLARRHVKLLMEKDVDVFEMSRKLVPMPRPGFDWKGLWQWATRLANAKVLLAAAFTWFLLDVAYYANNLMLPIIMRDLGYEAIVTIRHGAGHRIADRCYGFAVGYAVVTATGTLPGYFFTVGMVDVIGRKPVQYLGFAAMTLALLVFSTAYKALSSSLLGYLLLYSSLWFFANFGPNSTTFIIPAEVFPARYRCTLFGISAAAGKAGAVVGVFGLGGLPTTQGVNVMLGALCVFTFGGLAMTVLAPETCGRSLDDMNERGPREEEERMRTSDSISYTSQGSGNGKANNIRGSSPSGGPSSRLRQLRHQS